MISWSIKNCWGGEESLALTPITHCALTSSASASLSLLSYPQTVSWEHTVEQLPTQSPLSWSFSTLLVDPIHFIFSIQSGRVSEFFSSICWHSQVEWKAITLPHMESRFLIQTMRQLNQSRILISGRLKVSHLLIDLVKRWIREMNTIRANSLTHVCQTRKRSRQQSLGTGEW